MNSDLAKITEVIAKSPKTAYKLLQNIDIPKDDYVNYAEKLRLECIILFTIFRNEDELQNYIKKLEEITKIKDPNLKKSPVYNILGVLENRNQNFNKSIYYYNLSLKYAKSENNPIQKTKTANNLGTLYMQVGLYEKAKEIIQKEIETLEQNEGSIVFPHLYHNLGDIYNQLKNYNRAIYCFTKSIEISKGESDDINLAQGYFRLAKLYKSAKDYINAKKYFEITIETTKITNHQDLMIKSIQELCDINLLENRYGTSLSLIDQIEDYIIENEHLIQNPDIYYLSGKTYHFLSDKQKAYKMYKTYAKKYSATEMESIKIYQDLADIKFKITEAKKNQEKITEENDNLSQKRTEIQRLYNDMFKINEMSRKITKIPDIKYIHEHLYPYLSDLVGLVCLVIYLYDEKSKTITTHLIDKKNIINDKYNESKEIAIDNPNSIVAYATRNKCSIVSNDFQNDIYKFKEDQGNEFYSGTVNSIILLPLMIGDKIIGGISIQSDKKNAYDNNQLNMLKTLSSHIAIAIKNSSELETLNKEIKTRKETQEKLMKTNEKLSRMSYIDSLTKIPNRRKFFDTLHKDIAFNKTNHTEMSILIIDIDFFKEYNDNYGHIGGDHCIKTVATTLNTYLIKNDYFLARYGGDEFIAILNTADYNETKRICDELMNLISDTNIVHEYSTVSDRVTLSIGAFNFVPVKDTEIKEVIQKADEELYKSKENGKARYTIKTCEAIDINEND